MRAFNDGLFTTDTASLNESTLNKLDAKLRRSQPNATKAIERLISEGKMQTDVVAPIGVHQRAENQTPFITFDANGKVVMSMDDWVLRQNDVNIPHRRFTLHENAIMQVAEKFGIPGGYLKKLSLSPEPWARDLAADILNNHSYNTHRQRVLIRAVGEEVRGVLSDQYKRYDARDIVGAFMESVQQAGGTFVDGHMSDTKIYLEAMRPEPIIVPTQKNGDIVLCFGSRLSTSDYGDGALEVKSWLMHTVCMNDMTRESQLKRVHLGSRLPDNIQLSQRTYRKDTETMASAIRDITANIFDYSNIKEQAIAIQRASEKEVDMDKELKNLSRGKITKDEAYQVQKILNRSNPEDGLYGEGTLWKLANGLTAYARETEPQRKRELAEVAGSLLK